MTQAPAGRSPLMQAIERSVALLVAIVVVAGATVGAMSLFSSPTHAVAEHQGEEHEREAHLLPGLAEFAGQLVLVGAAAFAGRRILKIRL